MAENTHLADRKDSFGNFVWSNDILKKFLRDGDLITVKQRRDAATSSLIGAKGIRQRAQKKYLDEPPSADCKFTQSLSRKRG